MLRIVRSAAQLGQWRPISRHQHNQWIRNFQIHHSQMKKKDIPPKLSVHNSEPMVMPGTSSSTVIRPTSPPPGPVQAVSGATPASPSSTSPMTPETVPRIPPTPPQGATQTSPPMGSTAKELAGAEPISSTTPPPRRLGFIARLRRLLLTLIAIGGLSFGAGLYFALRSDTFHDLFTEYVPLGDDAVAYFENRAYQKRNPKVGISTTLTQVDSSPKVTISSKSGVSSKLSSVDGKPHSSETSTPTKSQAPSAPSPKGSPKAQEKRPAPPSSAESRARSARDLSAEAGLGSNRSTLPAVSKVVAVDAQRAGDSDPPSKFPPIQYIDAIKVQGADEPLVQDLVKMLNDIIAVVNQDGLAAKYNSSMRKAKDSLTAISREILALKTSERENAASAISAKAKEFDNATRELLARLDAEMQAQEGRWQDEFSLEREKIAQAYSKRWNEEQKTSHQATDRRIKNELLEQAINLRKEFLGEVAAQVDGERNGRLAKLSDLASNVADLENLTAEWNKVVESNLRTQHLTIAIEAVKSALENADRPRPFVRELAALKDISAQDAVISAAIASINPAAYQKGVPTSAQLIDRFRRVASEVRKAALLPEDAGVASHAASTMLSKLMFKKKGMTVGDDVESILTRTETLLEEGNLDDATREMNTLDGWAKTLSSDWLNECRRVLEVRQAMDVIATEARLEALKVNA